MVITTKVTLPSTLNSIYISEVQNALPENVEPWYTDFFKIKEFTPTLSQLSPLKHIILRLMRPAGPNRTQQALIVVPQFNVGIFFVSCHISPRLSTLSTPAWKQAYQLLQVFISLWKLSCHVKFKWVRMCFSCLPLLTGEDSFLCTTT